jgi:hypothetical protein
MTEQEWRERFAKRIMEVTGCDKKYAKECADVAEHDPEWTPEDSADEEMSYWSE